MNASGPTQPGDSRVRAIAHSLQQTRDRIRRFQHAPQGWYIAPLVATLAWSTLWAAYDAAVVGYAFRCPTCAFPNEWMYWVGTWIVVFPITSIAAFRRWAWLPILAVWLGGWEDILFYWVQGRAVPPDVLYLFLTPTDAVLYLRAVAFLVAAVLCMRYYHRRSERARASTDSATGVMRP